MVVDDHPMWREGVSRDLAAAGYDVVAATGEGRQAVRIADLGGRVEIVSAPGEGTEVEIAVPRAPIS